jgi:hypothetical protein
MEKSIWECDSRLAVQKISDFMESESSLSCLQEPTNVPNYSTEKALLNKQKKFSLVP